MYETGVCLETAKPQLGLTQWQKTCSSNDKKNHLLGTLILVAGAKLSQGCPLDKCCQDVPGAVPMRCNN